MFVYFVRLDGRIIGTVCAKSDDDAVLVAEQKFRLSHGTELALTVLRGRPVTDDRYAVA